jgi:hypothetical protein
MQQKKIIKFLMFQFLYVFLRTFKPNSMIFKIKMDLPVRENILDKLTELKVSAGRMSNP